MYIELKPIRWSGNNKPANRRLVCEQLVMNKKWP